ncbi:tetraacyldisaccharide 4'-kinase [Roseibium sp.]|uniref:tetraacyldisaccharide 4'-kinase n=1 Tax=Roseibium sp. TaxID=1936156 RepID=UPI003A97387A
MSGFFAKAPAFWWRKGMSWQSFALSLPGLIYGQISGRRMLGKPSGEISLPVICIGNFVLGGAGKTPFSLRLAERLQDEGLNPGFLLRGYGGRLSGPVLVDPARHGSDDVGDEALLLTETAPTVISADRFAGGRFAAALAGDDAIDILIMDDGFQNPALHKDLSLVLVDADTGLGNGQCFPAGPLRAPLNAQIVKTDVLVVVGEGKGADEAIHQASRKGLPFFHARLQPEAALELTGKQLFAFAGIGRPEKFYASLESLGLSVARKRSFPDHHSFSRSEAEALLTEAESDNLQLVTTTKDMARLSGADGEIFRWLASRAAVLPVRMEIDQEDRLIELINEMRRSRLFRSTI